MVLNREKFDKWLAGLAKKQGAKINLNCKFTKFKKEKDGLLIFIKQKGKIKKIKTDILIGADGTFSQVAKGLGNHYNFIHCLQADIIYKGNPKIMNIFFSQDYKGLFAWIIPKNSKVSEVGLGCYKDAGKKFKEFLKEKKIYGKILHYTGGPINLYDPSLKISDKNVFLIGEAASFVKGSSHGGIISSLKSAKALANSLIKKTSYEKELKKLRKEMKLHYLIKKVLDKFSDADYDSILKLGNKKVRSLLSKYSRDEYSNNLFKLKILIAQPALVKFLLKFGVKKVNIK